MKQVDRRFGGRMTGVAVLLLMAFGCGADPGESAVGRSGAVADPAADTLPATGTEQEPAGADARVWTAGITTADHEVVGVAVQQELRVARNEGFDRVVFVFRDEIPSYHVEYVDRPVRACGSGHVVEVDGDGWLSIRFTPARAHTEAGQATVTERNQPHDHPVIRQVRNTCDFEANLEWVIGTASPNHYRIMELREPSRVVVDIRH